MIEIEYINKPWNISNQNTLKLKRIAKQVYLGQM